MEVTLGHERIPWGRASFNFAFSAAPGDPILAVLHDLISN